jgi:hypothetical protein
VVFGLGTTAAMRNLSLLRRGISENGGFGVFQLFFAPPVAVLFDEAASPI